MHALSKVVAAIAITVTLASATAYATTGDYGPWSQAVAVEASSPGAHPDFNGAFLDGCPFVSRDGKSFYMARGPEYGGQGGIDIWVSRRASAADPWGAPVNVGPPVNSAANDFCPTISRDGHLFFFVSNRPGSCGGTANDDIYTTRLRPDGWDPVENVGCQVNSPAAEASPFPLPRADGPALYFSSTRAGTSDVYVSEFHGGSFGTASPAPGVNSPTAQDGHPNLRRDGLELFFFSTRQGGQADIYSATRASSTDAWSTPVNLGSHVNSAAAETRPSLSWDGTTLYFGSTRTGDSDHYVTIREALNG